MKKITCENYAKFDDKRKADCLLIFWFIVKSPDWDIEIEFPHDIIQESYLAECLRDLNVMPLSVL